MDETEAAMCELVTMSDLEIKIHKKSSLILPATKLWLAVNLVTHAVLPTVINFCCNCIRNQRDVVYSIRNQLLPAFAAFLVNTIARSLAAVPRISLPVSLRTARVNHTPELRFTDISDSDMEVNTVKEIPEKTVECIVLAEPTVFENMVDVIFIHGLHGGLDKTWRQGSWRHDRHVLKDQSPLRRESSGNLYVPRSNSTMKRTLSEIYSKIPKKIAKTANEISMPSNIPEEGITEASIVAENNVEDCTECWPQDWLPKDCPNARVIALNYSTDMLWCPVWQKKRTRTNMLERSKEMIEELLKFGVGSKPIVWVGHSKGGLYIKQILIDAYTNSLNNANIRKLLEETKTIMFYSVPHRGSALAEFTFPLLRRSVELLEIRRNCKSVLDLHEKFLNIFKNNVHLKPDIFSFIETSFTFMGFVYMKVISYESADPQIGIKCDVPLDHREICKPAGRDCFLYLQLVELIKKCSKNKNLICS